MTSNARTRAAAPILAAAAIMVSWMAPGGAMAQDGEVAAGKDLAERLCARCHAVGMEGASRLPIAPPFRTLSQQYPVESLQEALAEGIVTGHPQMPEFEFEPDQVTALVAYIKSVQE